MSSCAVVKFGLTATAVTLFLARLQAGVHQLIEYRTREQLKMAQTLGREIRRERSRPRTQKGGSRKTSPPPALPQAAKPTGIKKASSPYLPPLPARRPQRAVHHMPSPEFRRRRPFFYLPPAPPSPLPPLPELAPDPEQPPSPSEDLEARDARLRKEFQERATAVLHEVMALDNPVRDRLRQGLPAWEPSGHSGWTPEEEQAYRQRAIGQMLAAERERREHAEQQRLQLVKALHFKQKMEHLRRLCEIGAGLKTVLGRMGEAWDADDAGEFARLAQMTAFEGLKPAFDILDGLPLRRFDVCSIEWPLEMLDEVYQQLWLHDPTMSKELGAQLVDFVRGLEACGQLLGAALTKTTA